MLLRILDHLEEWLITFLIGAATLLIFVAVLHRYGMDLSVRWGWDPVYDWLFAINLSWAQELCIYMFVWMAKFGAAYGVRTGIHVGVDVLINQLTERWRRKFVLFGLGAGAVFTGLVGTFGATFVWHMAHTDATSPDLEIPAWIPYLAIPLGSYLMCFRFLQVAWAFFWTGELPVHEQAKVEGLDEEIERDQAAGRPEVVLVGESVTLTEDREHILGPRGHDRRTGGRAKPGSRRGDGGSK